MSVLTLEKLANEALAGSRQLTAKQRSIMIADAHQIAPSYPPEQAPADDRGLAEWWLSALNEYVSAQF